MTFETDQSRAAENRAHRLTDADCHAWGDDEQCGISDEAVQKIGPATLLVIAVCAVVSIAAAVHFAGWMGWLR